MGSDSAQASSEVLGRLGEHMKTRRRELGMSINATSRSADVDRVSWMNWEASRRLPHDHNRTKIEKVLKWKPGSVATILHGGNPTPADEEQSYTPRVDPDDPAGAIREILDHADWMSESAKIAIRALVDGAEADLRARRG